MFSLPSHPIRNLDRTGTATGSSCSWIDNNNHCSLCYKLRHRNMSSCAIVTLFLPLAQLFSEPHSLLEFRYCLYFFTYCLFAESSHKIFLFTFLGAIGTNRREHRHHHGKSSSGSSGSSDSRDSSSSESFESPKWTTSRTSITTGSTTSRSLM